MPKQPVAVQLALGQEPRPAACLEQHVGVGERVQVGDVVARHQDRALRRDVLQPLEAPVQPQGDGRAQGPLGEAIPGLGSAQRAPPGRLVHSRAVCMLPAMRVLAVPVKSLERAKSRLASLLSAPERAALSLVMFEDVLGACLAQSEWDTWVVSHDAVVLAGLPMVTAEALASALFLGGHVGVVGAPAASDGGTNLLLRRPPSIIPARFGRSSFAKHRWAARRARAGFEEIRRPELAFDLDRPQDLARVLTDGGSRRTRSACLEMGVAERLRVHAISL